jgi:two-component system cell cycle response regulator
VAGEPFVLHDDGSKLPVTVSIGIAVTGAGEETQDTLLKRADDALYAAKNGGRNRVIAFPVDHPSAKSTIAIAS